MITKFDDYDKPKPEVGEYVLCTGFSSSNKNLNYLIKNNIGKLIKIEGRNDKFKISYSTEVMKDIIKYCDEFEFITNDLLLGVYDDEITYWSKNKEELEVMLQANKYNL